MNKTILTGLAALAVAVSAARAQTRADIPDGLIAWWRAENNALDAVGANNGTLTNGVAFAPGRVGQAFNFDGTNGFITLTNAGSVGFGTGDFTIETWVKFNSLSEEATIFNYYDYSKKGAYPNSQEYDLEFNLPGALRFLVRDTTANENNLVSPVSLIAGQWYHLAAVRLGNINRLYLNGALLGSQTNGLNMNSGNDGTASIGRLAGGPGRFFPGNIDEVSIFNRPLTSNEIAAIYAADTSGKNTDKPYFLSSATLPDGIVGVSYSVTLAAAVTPGPQTFSLVGGSLPLGLTLAANGVISGTPLSDSSSSFTVQAVSSLDQTNAKTFTLRTYTAPPGMIAWWRGQNEAVDSVGTNHGVLTSGATFLPGEVGQAFSFDGVNDYVDFPNVVTNLSQFTFEFWTKINSFTDPFYVPAFSQSQAVYPPTQPQFIFVMGNGADSFGFVGEWQDGISSFDLRTTIPFGTNVWKHVAVTYDGNAMRQYVDGQLLNQATHVGKTLGSPQHFWLGRGFTYPALLKDNFLNGLIDEFSVSRRALTANEVTAIYNAGAAGKSADKPYFLTLDPLPDGGGGTPYSLQVAASVTPGPHTFALVNGALPPGLEFTNGLIYGTPTVGATNSLTILATSSLGQTNSHTFTLPVQDYVCPAPPGMVGWWRGQDDALDAASTNHGILVNGATFAAGKVGQAISFDGVDDYVQVPITGVPVGNEARTIEFWMKTTALEVRAVFIYGAYSAGSAFYTAVVGSKLVIGQWGFNNPSSTKVVTDGLWHHAAMVYDGAGTTRLYVDGTLDAIRSGYSYNTTAGNFYFGGAPSAGPLPFAGLVDEFTIYNRALSSNEVAAIYNAGAGGKCGMVYITSLSPLPGAGEGAAYSQPIATTGGTAPYSFTLLSGALPAGLALTPGGVLNGIPTVPGLNEFTVRVTDAPSRPADRHFFLKVNARPVLPVIASQSVNELATLIVTNIATDLDAFDTLTYALINSPTNASISPSGVVTWTPTEAQGSNSYAITGVVTDNGEPNLSATNTFSVFVNEVNVAPVLTLPVNTNINELVPFTANATATDPDLPANALVFALVSGPANLTVSPGGEINWTPTEAQGSGAYVVTVRVVDENLIAVNEQHLATTNSFTLTVNEVNVAPSLTVPADQTLTEETALNISASATDEDLPLNGLSYFLISPPAGMMIHPANGGISWTPDETQGSNTYTITVVVTDDSPNAVNAQHMSATNTFRVTVNESNRPPVLTVPINQTLAEETSLNVSASATDPDVPANPRTFALVAPPAGMTIDSANGAISWTPTEAQGSNSYTILVTVTDNNETAINAAQLTVTNSFTVIVNEVNVTPVLALPANTSISELVPFTTNATATDADLPANALTFALVSGPTGLTVSSVGVIAWMPGENQGPSTNTIVVSVTDMNALAMNATSLSVTSSFEIVVREVNAAPVLDALSNRTMNPGQTISFTATATDGDLPANALTYWLVGPPAGADISSGGLFTWRPTMAQADTTNSVQVRVQDNGAPVSNDVKSFIVIVNPVAPVVLKTLAPASGQFRFTVSGSAGPDYVILRSGNLTNWTGVVTNLSPSLPFEFSDSIAAPATNHFYRIRLQP